MNAHFNISAIIPKKLQNISGGLIMQELKLVNANKIFLSGRLTRDPELRNTSTGVPVASIPIANNRRFKNKSGEFTEEANFFKIVAWGRLAEVSNEILKKGAAIYVEGRLRDDSWENNGEVRRSVHIVAEKIQFLNRNGKNGDTIEHEEEEELVIN
jgi:single-strand DNA-binding protein